MSYETGGELDPNQWGGAGGRYLGLMQFGPEEQRKYGVKLGMDVGDQVTAAENFLRDRGVKPGMGLMDPTVQSMPVPPAGTMLATPEMVVPLERLPTRSTTRWWIIASALRNSSDLDSRGCSYCYPLSKMLACPESQQDLWWHGSD